MSVTNLFSGADPTLANRYLAGQLSETERAAFETQLERNPTTLQELEATARLKVGLERLRDTGQLNEELRPVFALRPVLLGLAATLVAALIGFALLRGTFAPSTTTPLLAATPASFADMKGVVLPVAATFAVFRKRAGDYDAVIELPSLRRSIELRVLPQIATPSERYRVSLARMLDDSTIEPSASIADLTPADDGFVTVFADSARLRPGHYRMAVSSSARNADPITTETFVINVVQPAP